MTNLILSRKCNQACRYCFAGDPKGGPQPTYQSSEVFTRCLDFLDRSGIQQARFLGGEPTLHPKFTEYVQQARERGKSIIVFTNGLMPEPALQTLKNLAPEHCSVVLNISATGKTGKKPIHWEKRKDVLKRLGSKAQVGFTIDRPDFEMDFVIDLVGETGCKRSVRVGLAQPVLDGQNVYLPVRLYPIVGQRLLAFAEHAARAGIRIELDCGFVRCMFTDAAVARLETLGADLGWRCSPVIDIDTDGTLLECFPLSSKYNMPFENHKKANFTAEYVRKMFESRTAAYRQSGIYKDCSNCMYKQNQVCSGGCLVHVIRRFSSDPIKLTINN
jgi:MoaA/NifB/PqqE/SkfB family radical SAM enzyme